MGVEFIYPEFEVVRNENRCIACRACERQCANEVHSFDTERGVMISDETKCVNCQRCVSLCPTRALKIVKSDCTLRENANWQNDTIKEIYKQANSGGVLLSSMGNPKPLPVYWDRILINASQVTNPPIDPLREPMETKTFLGKKPQKIERDGDGNIEQKRQRDEQPDEAERADLLSRFEEKTDDDDAERDERYIPYDPPDDRAVVFKPSVLRKRAQNDSDNRKKVNSGARPLCFPLSVSVGPHKVHKHIEHGHGDGRHKLSYAEPCRKVRVDKVVEHTRKKVECVAAAEDQRGKAHQLSYPVAPPAKNVYARRNGKQQIYDIKSAFSVFHKRYLPPQYIVSNRPEQPGSVNARF